MALGRKIFPTFALCKQMVYSYKEADAAQRGKSSLRSHLGRNILWHPTGPLEMEWFPIQNSPPKGLIESWETRSFWVPYIFFFSMKNTWVEHSQPEISSSISLRIWSFLNTNPATAVNSILQNCFMHKIILKYCVKLASDLCKIYMK